MGTSICRVEYITGLKEEHHLLYPLLTKVSRLPVIIRIQEDCTPMGYSCTGFSPQGDEES